MRYKDISEEGQVYFYYFIIIIAIASESFAEIWHDHSIWGKDHVERKNCDPAALQNSMQRCRIYNQPISHQIELKFGMTILYT